jgi:alkylation response protein AidB-like acyl-CoA dehydrogenase
MDMQHSAQTDAADDPVARARALIPLLQSAASRIDTARELPTDVLDGMFAAGLFRLLVPKSCGGGELEPAIFVQCVEAIAMGDASAAWCMNQGAVSMMSAAYVTLEAAREAFGGERDVLAWGYGPNGRLVRAEGGWRVTGQWSFASGSRHSTWLGGHCIAMDSDGTPMRGPNGKNWERTALFRREQAKIVDNWQVMGLRGTGSDMYSVTDLFVDDAHVLTRDYAGERREPGPLYRFHMMQLYASGFAFVALGVARQALDTFIVMASKKAPAMTATLLRDNNAVQHIVGYSDARLQAARNSLLRVLEQTYAAAGDGELTVEQRMRIRQGSTYAIHEARDVVTAIYHEAGSTAIFDNQPFERRLRDINAVSQQLQGRRAHFETVGQHLMGLDTNLRNV